MTVGTIEKSARLADVAKAAKVSQGTVSNVFNRPNLVREEVREHVRAVAKAIGYHGADPKGRLLRAGKVNAIGVASVEPLSYFFDDPFARTLMEGVSEACDANGAGISLVSARNDEQLAWNIQSALVDGFILFCIEGGKRLVQLTRERQLPFVALALGIDDPTMSAIGTDDVAGGRLAASHLTGLGHRRFAILSFQFQDGMEGPATMADVMGSAYSTARNRVIGYRDALRSAGIDVDRVPILAVSDEDPASVGLALEALFAAPEPPTALLAQSDRIAFAALDWLRDHGLDVPGQVSVVGYDGVAEGADSKPALTTIAQPIAEIGRRAVDAILHHGGEVHREMLPVDLLVRGSTAPPPGR